MPKPDNVTAVLYDTKGREVNRRPIERKLAIDIAMLAKPVSFEWTDKSGRKRQFRVEREHAALTLRKSIITAREY